MVLRYAHLAPEHLSAAAQRIERTWGVVNDGSSISLRQEQKGLRVNVSL